MPASFLMRLRPQRGSRSSQAGDSLHPQAFDVKIADAIVRGGSTGRLGLIPDGRPYGLATILAEWSPRGGPALLSPSIELTP